jgi:hypothetical protein
MGGVLILKKKTFTNRNRKNLLQKLVEIPLSFLFYKIAGALLLQSNL